MNAETDQALTRAYELIEQDRLDEAQAVLKPIVANEKDNADAWWLYAHAVTDTDIAREAIRNVLRVDPKYPEARELLGSLEQSVSAPQTTRSITKIGAQAPSTLPAAPPTLPDLPEGEGSQFKMAETGPRQLLGTRQIAILVPIVLIVIVVVLLLLLNSSPAAVSTATPTTEELAVVPTLPVTTPLVEDTGAPTVEQIDEQALETEATATSITTDAPIATPEAQPTDAIISTGDDAAANNFDALYEALSAFTIPRNGIEISETNAGNTLLVSICTSAGPELRTDLNDAMSIIAINSTAWADQVDAIGAHMVNCGTNSTLLLISAAVEDVVAYADGELDEGEFQSRWVSQ
jgi:hypothetical protein